MIFISELKVFMPVLDNLQLEILTVFIIMYNFKTIFSKSKHSFFGGKDTIQRKILRDHEKREGQKI